MCRCASRGPRCTGSRCNRSAIIHSCGGLHVYWFLAEPIDLQTPLGIARAYQWLAISCTSAAASLNPRKARVLRIPDTRNQKYPHTPCFTLLSFRADRKYALADVITVLGEAHPHAAPTTIDGERPAAVDHHVKREARIRRAQAFLKRQRPANRRCGK